MRKFAILIAAVLFPYRPRKFPRKHPLPLPRSPKFEGAKGSG